MKIGLTLMLADDVQLRSDHAYESPGRENGHISGYGIFGRHCLCKIPLIDSSIAHELNVLR
jgi:hypothetical protein